MTREQAKHNQEAIKAFGEGKNLWWYSEPAKEWYQQEGELSIYHMIQNTYIIEDEHFEARKADALGEPIEGRDKQNEVMGWIDATYPTWDKDCEYRPKSKAWYDYISEDNPILCWVCSTDRQPRLIKNKEHEMFRDTYNNVWSRAEPIKPSECWQGVDNET